MSYILAGGLRRELYGYSSEYAEVLFKHLTSETEVNIVNGRLTDMCQPALQKLESEMSMLQYRSKLHSILEAWENVVLGQPVQPEAHNQLREISREIYDRFEAFINNIQSHVIKKMRADNKQLCSKACKDVSQIMNLTEFDIPPQIVQIFKDGSNIVPIEGLIDSEIRKHLETDIISAAVKFSWDENKVYPLYSSSAGPKTVLEQLATQAPANSKQLDFYAAMYEGYKDQLLKLEAHLSQVQFIDSKNCQNMLPKGTILSTSDKNLGPVLLPIDWYIQQYEIQAVKGNHVVTKMSPDQCINLLNKNIQDFRSELLPVEKISLQKYFSKSNPNFKVGVLKVIPKIHKLSTFDNQAWKKLPSMPIRSAENCPINPYSIKHSVRCYRRCIKP